MISCLQSVDACVAELFDMFPHTPRMHDMCANVADEDWYEPKDLGIKWTRKQLEKVEEGDEVQRQRPKLKTTKKRSRTAGETALQKQVQACNVNCC